MWSTFYFGVFYSTLRSELRLLRDDIIHEQKLIIGVNKSWFEVVDTN